MSEPGAVRQTDAGTAGTAAPPEAAAFAAVKDRLSHGSREERRAAARELRRCGPAALDPLIHALRDGDAEVREAAIESLGELRDPRAITPLVQILHGCCGGFTVRDFRTFGLLMVLSLVGGLLMIPMGLDLEGWSAALSCIVLSVLYLVFGVKAVRRERSRMIAVTGAALAKIAEQAPRPELRSVMDDLKVLSGDVLQVESQTRRQTREYAARLEALTERIKSLPLTAEPPTPDARTLPQPAAAPPELAELEQLEQDLPVSLPKAGTSETPNTLRLGLPE